MKLGCSSWSYHKAIAAERIDQREWLHICAEELDLDGVELLDIHFPALDKDYLREIKKTCTDAGLTISCVSVSNDFGLADADARDREVAKVKQWVNITSFFGAPVLRVFAGWYHGVKKGDAAANDLWPDVIERLAISAEYAAEQGVVLGIENHNGGGIVATADEVERCLRDVKSPWLRLNLDTGDYGDTESVRRTLPHAVHIHAKMYELDGEGADRQDWPAIAGILRDGGYRGFLSIEYEGEEDPVAAVPRAVGYLRGLLG
ncbi:MAG: sugar phosphate isomerase/epimerase family protein [Dehalococcoidia bacterium]